MNWWGLALIAVAGWALSREFDAQKKRTEESEKRAMERDAATRALLETRIEKLEFTVFPSQSDLITVWLDKTQGLSKASSATDSTLE